MEHDASIIWLVLRTDDAGNSFVVEDHLDDTAAAALVDKLTARGHKQTYTAHSYSTQADRTALLLRFNAST